MFKLQTSEGRSLVILLENVTGTVSTLSNHDTDDLSEGSSNLYFTNERAQDAIGTMLSGNTETLITVTYDDSNNEIDFCCR